jgi:hypothetical protein
LGVSDDNFLNLYGTAEKNDVKLDPDSEIGKQIKETLKKNDESEDPKEYVVTIIASMGEEQPIAFKEAPQGS